MEPQSEVRPVFFCRCPFTYKPVYRWQWVYKDERMTVYSGMFRDEIHALGDLAKFQAMIIKGLAEGDNHEKSHSPETDGS